MNVAQPKCERSFGQKIVCFLKLHSIHNIRDWKVMSLFKKKEKCIFFYFHDGLKLNETRKCTYVYGVTKNTQALGDLSVIQEKLIFVALCIGANRLK